MNNDKESNHHINHYLLITEDGSVTHHSGIEPPDGSIAGCDSGACDLIDITDPSKPLVYALEGWTDLDQTPLDSKMCGQKFLDTGKP